PFLSGQLGTSHFVYNQQRLTHAFPDPQLPSLDTGNVELLFESCRPDGSERGGIRLLFTHTLCLARYSAQGVSLLPQPGCLVWPTFSSRQLSQPLEVCGDSRRLVPLLPDSGGIV